MREPIRTPRQQRGARARVPLAVVAVGVLLSGCSGSSSAAGAAGSTGSPAAVPGTNGSGAAPGSTSSGSAATPSTGLPTGVHSIPASVLPTATRTTMRTPAYFSTPSHNISCAMTGLQVRCDIAQHSWKAPAKPSSCQLDYGNGLTLSGGAATFTCAGDTVLGQKEVLPYGEAMLSGIDACSVLPAGVRCLDLTSRHGFVLAKESYQFF